MELAIKWPQPMPLKDGSAEDLMYTIDEDEFQAWKDCPGVLYRNGFTNPNMGYVDKG